MNVLILAYTPETYATRRFDTCFRGRAHRVLIASPLEFCLEIGSGRSRLLHKGSPVSKMDVVLLRGLRPGRQQGALASRLLEGSVALPLLRAGALCFNSPDSRLIAANKWATIQLLASSGIPVPDSIFSSSSDDIEHIVARLGTPLIIKTLFGTWGLGVIRCDSLESARSTFDALQLGGQSFFIQRYIADSHGQDIRVLVVGDRVLGAIRCFARQGDFRSNMARGARAEPISLSPECEGIAIRAARATGVEIAGVDLIESRDGPLVLEVNSVPGLEAIDRSCSVDSALTIVKYIESRHAGQSRSDNGPVGIHLERA